MAVVYSWRLAWLIAIYNVQTAYDHFLLYVLFSLTDYACDFLTIFGVYYTLQSTVQIFRSALLGPMVDAAGFRVIMVLKTCVSIQIVLQLIMYFLTRNAWTIIGLQLGLTIVNQLSQNSIFKIAKLHLQIHFPGQTGEQAHIINSLQNWGEGVATMFLLVACLASYLMGHFMLPYQWSKYFVFGVSLIFTVITLAISLTINLVFIKEAAPPPIAAIINYSAAPMPPSLLPAVMAPHNASVGAVESDAAEETRLVTGTSDAPEDVSCCGKVRASLQYLKRGFTVVWQDSVVWYATLIYFLLWTYQYVVYVPLTLKEAARTAGDLGAPTLENYCNGVMTNLFQQGYVLNIIYVLGSVLYGITIVRIKPIHFFRYAMPGVLLALIGGTWALVLNLESTVSAFLVSILGYLGFAMYFYCQNIGLGVISGDLVGFYLSYLGVMGAVLLYVPSAFTETGTPLVVVVIACTAMLLLAIALSITFGIRHGKRLITLGPQKH